MEKRPSRFLKGKVTKRTTGRKCKYGGKFVRKRKTGTRKQKELVDEEDERKKNRRKGK